MRDKNQFDFDNIGLSKIQKLLEYGDTDKISDIMSDYNSKYSSYFFKDADELISKSKYKEEILALIRAKLGIFG